MEKIGPRKVLRAPALRRGREIIPLSDRVKLERVLGLTVSCNAALDCDPITSIVAYPAGCVIVLYNVRKNRQCHILSASKKTITCLAFSWDGKYLVTGECGHQPHVRVWDVQDCNQVAEFSGHKYGINCVAFSPNLKYVVSVGTQHDMIVNVWEWKSNVKIASNKVSCKVKAISFASSGNYFVTVGNRHVKFWYLEYSRSTKYKLEPVPLMGRSAILGDQRNNYFCDVSCGRSEMADSTYAITKSGLLCEFNSRRLLDKWVELRTSSANCISVGKDYIFIGCAEGIVRCFNPFNLQFLCTLPRPHYLGIDIDKGLHGRQLNPPASGARFPNAIAISLDEKNKKVTCIYNDHSLYIWDIKDMKKIGKIQSFLYHSACIWGVETYPDVSSTSKNVLPKGTFLTCSSDDTIRIWNFENNLSPETFYQRNIYSFDLLKMIYTDLELTYLCDTDFSPSGSNDKVDTTYDGKNGVRCLRISPDGQHLAAGDRSGNIRIYDLQQMEELCKIEAHDAEVLCLEYSKPFGNCRYLASASRDRLIHVFDVNQDYGFQQTLDDHSSSITAVRFVQNHSQLQMISCAADKSIIFRRAQFTPQLNFVREHHVVGKTTLYDMEVDSQQRHVLTACQDRNIRVYNVNGGKHTRCFRGSQGEDGTLIKVVLDPSGMYLATSCTDKCLYIYDFFSGECLASMFGHSELVTGLKFTNCGRYLISVSGDGCIFLWKLPIELTQAMQSRQMCIDSLPNLSQDNNRKTAIAITKPVQVVEKLDEKSEVPFLPSQLIEPNDEFSPKYRFSMGQLPSWAKKQMLDESKNDVSKSDQQSQQILQPRGRWAQRLDEGGLVVRSYLNSDSVIPYPNIQENSQVENTDFNEDTNQYLNDDDNFCVCPESIEEIQMEKFPQISNGHVNLYHDQNKHHSSHEKQELHTSRVQTDSSSTSSLQLEDVEAEDERSDAEILDGDEILYYPESYNSEMNDSSFRICATNSEQMHLKDQKKLEKLTVIPNININIQEPETHSDEDEPSTPVDNDRTFAILNMSTENLDKLGQREQFMKSNYESLEKNSDSDTERDFDEKSHSLLPRYSISARFLAKSLQTIPRRSNDMNSSQSHLEHQSNLLSSKKREELNKALGEARKKLETLGWRGGLSSSKSISDLHNIPNKELHFSVFSKERKEGLKGDIRRASSLNDLSIISSSRILPTSPLKTPKISAPLWDQMDTKTTEEISKPHNQRKKVKSMQTVTTTISNKKLSRSASMSSLQPLSPKLQPVGSKTYMREKVISRTNYNPLVRASSSSNIITSIKVNSSTFPSNKCVSNLNISKSSSDSSSSDNSPIEVKRSLPPTPSPLPRQKSLAIGEVTKNKLPSRETKYANSGILSHSKSEWDITKAHQERRHSSGRLILDKLDVSNRKKQTINNVTDSNYARNNSATVRSLDVSSVPLTQELCEKIAEELKEVTMYSMQVFQRLSMDTTISSSEKSAMTTILAQGVWQAQQNLRPAVPPFPMWSSSSKTLELSYQNSYRTSSQSSDERLSSPAIQQEPFNAILLLQEYSDKLLSLVEQRIGNSGQKSS
ncbi:mitogen-activated protein kinase-binding protein 1-like isoform X2 [Centruroides vittatus]|uniref:mitogen-activated protein kinase-binding protein 1-like isoform X2 n=1 Tax=Centruroides vittatus TaxID=120091 RepID=UPI003510BA8F